MGNNKRCSEVSPVLSETNPSTCEGTNNVMTSISRETGSATDS